MSWFSWGSDSISSSSSTSTTSTGTSDYRCTEQFIPLDTSRNLDIKNLDVNKLSQFDIGRDAKNKIYELKKTNEKKIKADSAKKATYLSYPSTNKESNRTKRSKANSELQYATGEEQNKKKDTMRTLSFDIKEKAKKRTQRLINKPKEKRVQKLSCTLKALFDTLGQCQTTSNQNEIKITNFDSLISAYKDKFKTENPANKAFAESYIRFIIGKDPNAVDKIKSIQNIYPKASEELSKLISSIAICS
jgi:hypothetical protein